MRCALLTPHDPRWTEALSRIHHDTYHLPAYVEMAARRQEHGMPLAFVAEADGAFFLLPLIVRRIPAEIVGEEGWADAVSPRFYPGPIAGPEGLVASSGFVERAIIGLVELMRQERIVTAFVRLHPLLSPPPATLGQVGKLIEHGDSVSIDLTRSLEELWADTRAAHRRHINKGARMGYRVRIDESWERLDDFVELYDVTMERLGAAPHWRLTADYFRDLRAALGRHLHLCVVELDGELAAGALLTEIDVMAEYHLSGTATDHVAASPTKLIIDFARRWAKERGARVFHLGGSVGKDDPLIHWKLGFSPLRHPVASWRLIAMPDAYRELSARREGLAGWAPGEAPSDDFFPAYRRPLDRPADA